MEMNIKKAAKLIKNEKAKFSAKKKAVDVEKTDIKRDYNKLSKQLEV